MKEPATTTRRNAFTLVELLVVIALIVILIGAVIFAAPAVIERQQRTQTTGLLTALDRALDEYQVERGRFPFYDADRVQTFETAFEDAGLGDLAVIAPYGGRPHAVLPDAWMFYNQAQGLAGADAIFQGIPESLTRSRTIDNPSSDAVPENLVRFVDAWGTPVLFIHPSNDAAQDLFGRCQNNRPYFLSAGPDQRFGFMKEITGSPQPVPPETDPRFDDLQRAINNNLASAQRGRFLIDPDNLRASDVPVFTE